MNHQLDAHRVWRRRVNYGTVCNIVVNVMITGKMKKNGSRGRQIFDPRNHDALRIHTEAAQSAQ
jgi:hypothetical protein